METTEQAQVERVEIEERDFSVDVDPGVSVNAEGLHGTLRDVADSFDVTGFKCVKCGLVHQHDTTKHQLSKTFDAFDEADATEPEYNSVCHCGVQESARRGSDFGVDEGKASGIAENAPIPPEASREMDENLGSL